MTSQDHASKLSLRAHLDCGKASICTTDVEMALSKPNSDVTGAACLGNVMESMPMNAVRLASMEVSLGRLRGVAPCDKL
jgi:hypothetical protein